MLRIIGLELVVSILVSGVPILIAFQNGGVAATTELLGSLLPPKIIIIYFMSLSFLLGLFSWLYYRVLIGGEHAQKILRFIKDLLIEVGSGSHGLLRVAAGILLVFPLLWYFAEPSSFILKTAASFGVSGLLALFECAGFVFVLSKIKSKWLVR